MSRNQNKIFRFIAYSDTLAAGGQPTREQFSQLKADGYEAIVRFVVSEAELTLPEENDLVNQLGMEYITIPISFSEPTEAVYHQFCDAMKQLKDKKVFVHCVAGYCSASMAFLYEATQGTTAFESLEARLFQAWHPNEKWCTFIKKIIEARGIIWQREL